VSQSWTPVPQCTGKKNQKSNIGIEYRMNHPTKKFLTKIK